MEQMTTMPTIRENNSRCIVCGALIPPDARSVHCDGCRPAYLARIDAISEKHRVKRLEDENRRMKRENERRQTAEKQRTEKKPTKKSRRKSR